MLTTNYCQAVDKLCEVYGIKKEYLAVALGTNIECLENFFADKNTTYGDLRTLFKKADVDVTIHIRNFWKTPKKGEPAMQFLRNWFDVKKVEPRHIREIPIESYKPSVWWEYDDISLSDLDKLKNTFHLELSWIFSGIGENDEEIFNEPDGRLVSSIHQLSRRGVSKNFRKMHDKKQDLIHDGGSLESFTPSGLLIEEKVNDEMSMKEGLNKGYDIEQPGEKTADIPAEDPGTGTDSIMTEQESGNSKRSIRFCVYPEYRNKIKKLAILKYGNKRSTSKLAMEILNELPSNMTEKDFKKIFSKDNITRRRNRRESVECTIRVDEEENKQLESIARKTDLTKNEVLACLIFDYLKKVDADESLAVPVEAEDIRKAPETTPVEAAETVLPEESQADFETEGLEPLPILTENWDDREIPEQQPTTTHTMNKMTPQEWLDTETDAEGRELLQNIFNETQTGDYVDGRYGEDTLLALRPFSYPNDEKVMEIAKRFSDAVRSGEIAISRMQLKEPDYQTASLISLNSTKVKSYILMKDVIRNLLDSYGKTTLTLEEKMSTVGKSPFEFSSVTAVSDEDGKQILRLVDTRKKLFGEKAVTVDASPEKLGLQDWYTLAEAAEKHCSEVGRIHIEKIINRTDMEVTELKRTYNEKMLSALKTLVTETCDTGVLRHFVFFCGEENEKSRWQNPFVKNGKVFFSLVGRDETEETVCADDIDPDIVPGLVDALIQQLKKRS